VAVQKDYYELLGIKKNSSDDEIKKAYRKLAMKYHPDRNKGDKSAEAKFKEISEAYEVLSDPSKKQRYDQFGFDGLKSAFGPGGFDFSRDFTHVSDFQDLFGNFFGEGGGGIFDAFFGGGHQRSRRTSSRQGADLRFDLEIDLEEAAFGSKRNLTIPMTEACSQCHGSGVKPGTHRETCKHCAGQGVVLSGNGFFQVRQTCPVCGGTGTIVRYPCKICSGTGRTKTQKKLTLKIPKGVETGSRLRKAGKGESGMKGGSYGDLYVVLHVVQHDLFVRRGDDLHCEVPVSFEKAVLGGEIQVPTIDGYAKLKLSAGTETGKIFRLRGKGMPNVENYRQGDLHAHIVVEVPVKLNSKQKNLIKDLMQIRNDGNYPAGEHFKERAEAFYERKEKILLNK